MNFTSINSAKMEEIKYQMSVHRQNLLCVGRLAIKSLLGKSQYQAIDDSSPEFKNLATIMEHILSHRLKGQISWFGLEEPRDFWHFIRAVCSSGNESCINNIIQMEDVRSPKAKGRAWLRLALMEKKLGKHLMTALQNGKALRAFYGEGSFMRSEEAPVLVKTLLNLDCIDFSCCVKGEKLETGVASVIDYTPYLRFQISDEESQDNLLQEQRLFAPSQPNQLDESSPSDKLTQLQAQYRVAAAQKGYLEDVVNQREQQLAESRRRIQSLESMIMHLTEQVASLKEAQLMSRRELEEHLIAGQLQHQERTHPIMMRTEQDEIALDSISGLHHPRLSSTSLDQSSLQSIDQTNVVQRSVSPVSTQSGVSTVEGGGDTKTVPYSIPRLGRKEKEDTPSLIALAGSFTSQISAISVRSTETSSSGVSENQPPLTNARTLSPDSLSAVSFASTSEASPMLS
ncbi:RUN domain-containing protein 3B-like isoform X1 [Diadema antillarum]|uniref:RUN domain-containing protein 3B-like isoform X1 n=2 Tax=Diadema antillarum TaxID=105358 RepID=UPI003A88BB30